MRIALTIPYLPPYIFGQDTRKIYGDVSVGGAETWGWDFAQALRRDGFEVDLYTADVPALGNGWSEVQGIRVFRASVTRFVDIVPILGPDYAAELEKGDYDVYQFSLFAHLNFCEMMDIAGRRGKPTIFSHHGCGIITPDAGDRRRIMHALSRVDSITAPSLSSLEHYENTWIRRKMTVLPNGVDNRRFHPDAWRAYAPSRAAFRTKHLGGDGRPVILFVGRLLPHKGVLFLLEALTHLLDRPGSLRPRVVLGGTGDQKEELERFCRDHGLAIGNDVIFKGFVPDELLPALYSAADVFVLPSTRKGYRGETFMEPEAFGLVLTEAMSSGVPCVANDIPGVNSVVSHEVNGLLAEEGNARSLADTLGRVLGDARMHEILRLGGLQTANAVFNYDRIAATFRTMVERAVAVRRVHQLAPLPSSQGPADRRRLVFLAPSTTQFYSGQGRHLFEVARLLLDDYDIEIVTDDFVYRNLKPLFEFGDAFPVRISVLKGIHPNGTLDPIVPDLRTHLGLEPADAIFCPIGWANTFLAEAVLEERRGRLVGFVPHYQPTDTVPFATGELKERLERVLDTLLRDSDVVYAISREEVGMLEGRCGGEIRVALHGVNPDLFRTLPTRKKPLALFVGDLREPRKRLPLTLEVFREIRRRHPDFKLMIVGRCDDPDQLRRELPADLADAVSVSGYVSDDSLAEYYTRATLLINTASYEAFCIPLIEAMACATIPLVTRTGGVPSVVDDGVTGFLLDPDAPCASLDRVWPVLADPSRLETMRRAATRAVFRDFRWSTSAEVFRSGIEAANRRRGEAALVPAAAQRLRVLVVNDHFTPELVGGAEVYLHLLVADMARRADVTVARYAPRASQTRINGATVVYQPYDQPGGLDVDPSAFDVVHVNSVHRLNPVHYERLPLDRTIIDMHDFWGLCPNNEFVWFPDLPRLTRCHHVYDAADPGVCMPCQGDRGVERMRVRDRLIDRARWLIAHSNHVADRMRRRFPDREIHRIHYGIRHRDFAAIPRVRRPGQPFRVLFIGRISLTKGVSLFADMVRRLAAEIPDFEFLIAGNYAAYWDWYREFTARIREHGIERHVRLLGQVPLADTPSLFGLADVTIVPSLWDEPFGIVVIESLAAGCPVVASPYGGLGQIFEHDVHSLYLNETTSDKLADAVLRLRNDPALTERLTSAGKKFVAEHYSAELMVERTMDLYKRVSGKGPNAPFSQQEQEIPDLYPA